MPPGEYLYICVQTISASVNIRRFWTPPGTVNLHPTQQRQILSFDLNNELKDLHSDINKCLQNFNDFQSCNMQNERYEKLICVYCIKIRCFPVFISFINMTHLSATRKYTCIWYHTKIQFS